MQPTKNEHTDKTIISSDVLSDDEILRYSRQILLDGWDIDAQLRLKQSCIIIVGMGGLGCPLAETLVRAGVGHIHIIDNDVIEASNLQRQTLFTDTDIGQPKVTTAQKRLQKINPFVSITAYKMRLQSDTSNVLLQETHQYLKINSLSKINLICDTTDNFKTRDQINQLSVKQKIPLLSASAIAQEGQLALFEPEKNTGCYHCLFQGNDDDERRCVNTGVLASTTQVIANLQAQAALSYLGLDKNSLKQTLLLWQGRSLSIKKLNYQADPNCCVCHNSDKVN